MGFSFDINNNLKQSKMFLANPQKSYIGTINGVKNVKLKLNFNSLHELTFNIYENENNEDTEYYDKIIKMRLIELQYIGWFQIQTAVEKQDENSLKTYKEVKCYSLENELIYKKVYDISGVFTLYDVTDTSHSLLHIISNASGYSIGHIDNSLLGKWRTFDIASEQVYNLMTTTLSKSFECVFTFDTYTRSINCYELANMGSLTDIVISKKNILKEYIKDDGDSAIITKLRIVGGDDVDIRAVNPSGTNYRINLDYFMTTEWGIKQTTIDAWNAYKIKSNNSSVSYSSTLNTLKTKQSELLVLNTQLKDLQALLASQEDVKGSCMALFNPTRSPIASDTNYTDYQNAISLINTYTTQISNKKSEITNKEAEVAIVGSALEDICVDLDWSTNFTSAQLAEINVFITEDQDYEDSTFTETTTMSSVEVVDMKLELMQNGDNELARAAQPQFTYTTNVNNLLTICDDKDDLIPYSELRSQLLLGNLITIIFREDYNTTVRLMSLLIEFDNPENLDLVFSDKSRLDDALIQLAEVISTSGKAATSYSLSKYGLDQASSITNEVREFINGSLNATTNRVFSDDNIQTELGKYGIINRKWLPDQNKYDDRQSLLTQNVLLFTDDNWVSSKSGIGYFTNAINETYYGVLAEVICGDLVLTSALNITNQNNTITLNKDGAIFTNCDITINKGVNQLLLNATDGIKLTKNGVSQFGIDANGNATFGGILYAATGTFSGSLNAATGTFSGSLNAATGTFAGTLSAGISITSPIINSGTINGTVFNSDNGSNQGTKIENGELITSKILIKTWNTLGFDDNGAELTATTFSLKNGSGVNKFTANAEGAVTCEYINGSVPILENTKQYYSFKPEYHEQSSYSVSLEHDGNGNGVFYYGSTVATPSWCINTFEPLSASDFRLKKSIRSLDELPDELYYSLKPKLFEFKCEPYKMGISNIGLLAQQVESAFADFNLNAFDYGIVEIVDARTYTDEGMYVTDGKVHRVIYSQLISWGIEIAQKQKTYIENVELRTKNLETIVEALFYN